MADENAGVEMDYISESMGHSTTGHAITQIYIEHYPLETQIRYNEMLLMTLSAKTTFGLWRRLSQAHRTYVLSWNLMAQIKSQRLSVLTATVNLVHYFTSKEDMAHKTNSNQTI